MNTQKPDAGRTPKWRPLLFLGLFVVIMACGGDRLSHKDMFHAYQEALATTESRMLTDWSTRPDNLTTAINRLQTYYREITRSSVERLTKDVYANDAYLCDTLHIAHGADQIEAYFLQTSERVNTMHVTILDHSVSGGEVYTRWTMTIAAEKLAGGQPLTTYGTSHFRFNPEGKVILHQDFWDASAGFFEHLTGLGQIIPRIRGTL